LEFSNRYPLPRDSNQQTTASSFSTDSLTDTVDGAADRQHLQPCIPAERTLPSKRNGAVRRIKIEHVAPSNLEANNEKG
jgi:hypothetical protein